MIPHKIHPSKIALVPFSRIMDGTVTSFDTLKSDTDVWLVPPRVEDGVVLNFSGEQEDYEEQGGSGLLVLKDSVNKRFGLEFTINLGRWTFEIEQMMRGGKASDVATDQMASIAGADDATAMEGLGVPTTLTTEKFTCLIEMRPDKDTGDVLYLLLPKVGISFGDREQNLNHAQQNPAMTFKAYGLETANPDELTPVQTLYGSATDDGLIFPIDGQPDVV